MRQLLLEQIEKIKKLPDYNSQECIDELTRLNEYIGESELDLPSVKHLPTQLAGNLRDLEKRIKNDNSRLY